MEEVNKLYAFHMPWPLFRYRRIVIGTTTRYFFYKKLGFLARGSEIGLNFLAILKNIEYKVKVVKEYKTTHPNQAF